MPDFTITSNNPEGLIQQLRAIQQTGCGALTKECWAIANQIEEQAKPAIEEPLAFASVVKVRSGTLYVRLGAAQPLPWGSGEQMRSWDQLDVSEVLRIGVGEAAPSKRLLDFLTELHYLVQEWESIPSQRLHDLVSAFEIDAASTDEWARLDAANADTDAYAKGAQDTLSKVRGCLQLLRVEAITSERKSALDKAYAAVEELTP